MMKRTPKIPKAGSMMVSSGRPASSYTLGGMAAVLVAEGRGGGEVKTAEVMVAVARKTD